jgi:nitroreductase
MGLGRDHRSGDQAARRAWYREGFEKSYGVRRAELLSAAPSDQGLSPASYRAAEYLAGHLQEAPVWVIPVLRGAAGSSDPRLGASIYGAVQQLILAARAYGIGATLTSFYLAHETELKELLGLPADALSMALIPLGYRPADAGASRGACRWSRSSTGNAGDRPGRGPESRSRGRWRR